jgi:hypothetical protein
MITDLVGRDTHVRMSTTSSYQGTSTTHAEESLDVAPASWVNSRPPDEAIVHFGGVKPVIVRITGWWQDPRLSAMVPANIAERYNYAFGGPPRRRRWRR